MIVQVELLLNLAAETGEHLFPLGKTIEEQLALLRLDQIDFICFRQQPERLLERNNGAQQIFRRIIALGVENGGRRAISSRASRISSAEYAILPESITGRLKRVLR